MICGDDRVSEENRSVFQENEVGYSIEANGSRAVWSTDRFDVEYLRVPY